MEKIRDQILEKVDILDYISQYVTLKKTGKSYKGLCPFHSEKTPSFTVTPEKGLFYCFGCGASGNIITFVMKYNNLAFIDALKYLAERAGIHIDENGKIDRQISLLKKLHNELAVLARELLNSNKKVIEYLLKRGYDKSIADTFDLGIIPADYDIDRFIKRFGVDIIKGSGLFFYKNSTNIFRLAERLLFPIKDIYGEVIAFSGRDMDGVQPKYINSPETPVFKKGSVLYNLHLAKEHIKNEKKAYVVEGYFDVIRMWEHGYKNVVSSMGTAFTREQALILKRYTDAVVILFDGDQAGVNAAYKTLDPFIEINSIPEVVFLKNGEDPDSLLPKDPELFSALLEKKEDLLLLISRIYSKNSSSLSQKINNYESIVKKLSLFPESTTKSVYMKEVSKIFNIDTSLKTRLPKLEKSSPQHVKGLQYICEDDFLASIFMIKDDEVVARLIEDLSEDYFMQSRNKKIFLKLIDIIQKFGNIDALFNDNDIGEVLAGMLANKEFNEPYKTAIINKNKLIYNYKVNESRRLQSQLLTIKDDKQKLEIIKKISILTSEINKYNILEA